MTYRLTQSDCIYRISDGAWIPTSPGNTDYAAYLKWKEAGNTPEPAPAPPRPVKLTPAEKLKAAGLTVEELKELLADEPAPPVQKKADPGRK